LEACAVDKRELHRLEWENRKRADEVRELQKALSDSHTYLFEERERLLALQAENDELKLQVNPLSSHFSQLSTATACVQ
jgi:coiled-coil domain-containing protein 77